MKLASALYSLGLCLRVLGTMTALPLQMFEWPNHQEALECEAKQYKNGASKRHITYMHAQARERVIEKPVRFMQA